MTGHERTVAVQLGRNDLLAINNALNEVCNGKNAIPDREFRSLMAVERSQAQATLERISILLPSGGG
jgi:hypothetical protein